jgi:O-antigen/teichoic acid export membrane protein
VSEPDGSEPFRAASSESATRQAIRGVRWLFWLNVATLPMSFVTNVVLGRAGADVLGLYAATQLFVGGFQTFFIFGGHAVFTRIVPALPAERRLPFLASYAAIVLGVFSAIAGALVLVAPRLVARALDPFGAPAPALAYGISVSVVVWAFCSHFLYGVERAPRAAVALKISVFGYFVLALLLLTPMGPSLAEVPSRTLWTTTALTYLTCAFVAAAFVVSIDDAAATKTVRWCLPAGFWPVVVYTHLGKLVEFVYMGLSPSVVLLWLDVTALGRLSAALRWVALLALLPGMLVSVVAPGLTRLEATGFREEALRQARAAVRAADLANVPCVLALVLFAEDLMGLFGADYRAYAGLLRIVALSSVAGPVVYLGAGLAVAFGALRTYLAVSVVYVVASVALNAALVPVLGLTGAALATTLSTAVQAIAVAWVVRRMGLVLPASTLWGSVLGVGTLLFALWMEPGRPVSALAWAVGSGAFAWVSGLTWAEARRLAARLLGSAS